MADSTVQTQNNGSAAATAPASSEGASSNAAADSPQTATPIVDKGSAEGKSASSDGDSGAAGDGAGQRPGRAERKISELTSKIKELEASLNEQNKLSDKLNANPVDASQVQLPDYSQMAEITPDQLKKDIISAASQIVDLKMQTTANVLETKLTQKEALAQSNRAMSRTIEKYSVLNPQSDDYDSELDHEITEAFTSALEKNPAYSFATFIKPFTRTLDMLSNTTGQQAASKSESRSRGTSANRSSTSSRKGSNEFDPNWDTAKMEAWFAQNR